ncbi:MAG: cobalamin B12-binding domain-containing protein [Elusimicrobia bacterium]|nr:cobalamin B12-binding domain-containing protein [Elusimicrobiota bacterium]
MRVGLVTLQDDLNCYGLRCLSSALREKGVETRVLMLDRWGADGAAKAYRGGMVPYESRAVDQAIAVLDGCDLVGFSVMTLYHRESAAWSGRIRRALGVPIVWGGIHPICRPEECLEHADIICRGEAEETLPEIAARLAGGDGLEGLPGVWFRKGSEIVQNPVRQPARELDGFPFPDISVDGHYAYRDGNIQPLTAPELLRRWKHTYMTIDARGCALRCTYCCNSQLARHFDWTIVRAKGVPRIIAELRAAVRRYPGLEAIKLSDDAFGDLPIGYIRDFAQAYKREVGLPLDIPGFSPSNLTREKLELLVDAGLMRTRIGIQAGSPRIRRLYGRSETDAQILQAVETVQSFRPRIKHFKIDVITDNPWESEEEVVESIRLLLRLPRPYSLALFSLTLYPGTPLYTKAEREGLVASDGTFAPYRLHFYGIDQGKRLNRILDLFRRPDLDRPGVERLVAVYRDPEAFEREYERYVRSLPSPPLWRKVAGFIRARLDV